jgi:hypothetical protein
VNIDLTKPCELPAELAEQLSGIEDFCREQEFSENLVEIGPVAQLVCEIDALCMSQNVVGLHYSRALPEDIRAKGLLVREGDQIRNSFLAQFANIFTENELTEIRQRWSEYFEGSQASSRDGKIFFNFTEAALIEGGAERLIGLYGGEQVSMCFEVDEPIGVKLASIGEPLLIRCALKPSNVRTFIQHPWGKILVASFHLQVNPEAIGIDQDGYQTMPVPPEDILEIRTLTSQISRTRPCRAAV